LKSLDETGAAEGLQYNLAETKGGNTFDAHRLIHLGYTHGSEKGAEVKEALLAAYFIGLEPISDPDVLSRIGVDVGLPPDEVSELLAGDRFAAEVREDEAEANRLGCTGVPFFVIDRAFAVPGAQDAETFRLTLERAWSRSHPEPGSAEPSRAD
jgi:predicted DsbA family dithiol-disulfide isomerase